MGILRFILALSVLISHSTPVFGFTLIGDDVRVRSFFIISGFYMSLVLNEKYNKKEGSYKLFVTSRLLRIFPLYWVIITMSVTLYFLSSLSGRSAETLQLYFNQIEAGAMHISTLAFFIFTNIFILGQNFLLLLAIDNHTGMLTWANHLAPATPKIWQFLIAPQSWSMSVEILFYLMAPFILRKNIYLVILVFLMSVSLRIYFYYLDIGYLPWEQRFFLTELAFFLAGRFSYDLYKKYGNHKYSGRILASLLTIFLFHAIIFEYFQAEDIKMFLYFIIVVITIPFLFTATKNIRFDRYMGELAYPMYVSHLLMLVIVNATIFPKIESIGTTLAIVTIIFSCFLNQFVARPLEKARKHYLSRAGGKLPQKT